MFNSPSWFLNKFDDKFILYPYLINILKLPFRLFLRMSVYNNFRCTPVLNTSVYTHCTSIYLFVLRHIKEDTGTCTYDSLVLCMTSEL